MSVPYDYHMSLPNAINLTQLNIIWKYDYL